MTLTESIHRLEHALSGLGEVDTSSRSVSAKDVVWNVRRRTNEQVTILKSLEKAVAAKSVATAAGEVR